MTVDKKKLWKNEYFQTFLVTIIVIASVLGIWYGSQAALHTKSLPFYIVSSGSMCIPYDANCDGWSHPFTRTLHLGDIIVIEGVDPKTLKTSYPNGDIIVFQNPNDPTGVPIVHRITSETTQNGTLYFFTKGDGNPPTKWPNPVEPYSPDLGWYNPNYYNDNSNIPRGSVPQQYVIGKVIMRIPWLGWITIYTEELQEGLSKNALNIGVSIFVILVAILIIAEFIAPIIRPKKLPRQASATNPQT